MQRLFLAIFASLSLFTLTAQVSGPGIPFVGCFGCSRVMPANYQFPFSPNPFNVPICPSDPCSPTLDSNSSTMVSFLFTEGGGFSLSEIQEAQPGTNGSGQADTTPVLISNSSDPSYSINCVDYGGCSSFLPATLHIPNGAHASIDVDHKLAILDLTDGNEFDFWQFNCVPVNNFCGANTGTTAPVSGGGSVTVGFASNCAITSYSGATNNCSGSAMAAGVAMQPGSMDPRTWITLAQNGGTTGLSNTIFVALPCPNTTFTFPARKSDGACSSGVPEGECIWLDTTDATINGFSINPWAKVLLHTMHDYGLMAVDTIANQPASQPWSYEGGLDNETTVLWGQPRLWDAWFTEVENEGTTVTFSNNASHLAVPEATITSSNIHIAICG